MSGYPTYQELRFWTGRFFLAFAQKLREMHCNSDDVIAFGDSGEMSLVIGSNASNGSSRVIGWVSVPDFAGGSNRRLLASSQTTPRRSLSGERKSIFPRSLRSAPIFFHSLTSRLAVYGVIFTVSASSSLDMWSSTPPKTF